MKILITGICGFAGSTIARRLLETASGLEITGVDNLMRPGCELNRTALRELGVKVHHGDLRIADDVDALPRADWVIDAAANPSVLAGLEQNGSGSRQLMRHNLFGTVNVLEFCKSRNAGLLLLSTSRVYSIAPLAALKMDVSQNAFRPNADQVWPEGLSAAGVSENFSTEPPLSLYGSSKLCSELLAREYGRAFGFPVWINRLGVLAGAGQFGRADQGIFSFWIHSCARRRPLRYIGFGGNGFQVRDCLHPMDLVSVIQKQMQSSTIIGDGVTNFSGGLENNMSLCQLHEWCGKRFGPHAVASEPTGRPFDVPWLVLDSTLARQRFNWQPATPLPMILEEIACHAEKNPQWLDVTA
jgi:CDP-paratose 2-epimerase